MAERNKKRLKAGEHYGSVSNKQRSSSAIYSETIYGHSMDLPEHSHQLGFFTLILDGHYSEIIRGRPVVYSPRTVLWRQADLSHKDKIEVAKSRFFFVEIDRRFGERMSEIERVPDHLVDRNGQLTSLTTRLRNEIALSDGSTSLIAEGITLELLGMLTRMGRVDECCEPQWLRRVFERLTDEFTDNISSEDLGREANVHPVHLAATFRRFYHESMGEYVQRLRIDRAAALLRERERPLSDIAYECGFADQSHFTRIFKRRIGLAPGAYRNSVT
jgi:AraC family transcriptional regulator